MPCRPSAPIFRHSSPREAVGLVELGGDRRHFFGGDALHLVAQGIGGLAQPKSNGGILLGIMTQTVPV